MTSMAAASGESGQPRRVLLVDDSVDAAEAMSMLLETLGHEVRTLHDGPSALAAVDEFAPEVVILDIGLPGMDGFEIAREMRLRPVTKAALMIALTGLWRRERSPEVSRCRLRLSPRETGFVHGDRRRNRQIAAERVIEAAR